MCRWSTQLVNQISNSSYVTGTGHDLAAGTFWLSFNPFSPGAEHGSLQGGQVHCPQLWFSIGFSNEIMIQFMPDRVMMNTNCSYCMCCTLWSVSRSDKISLLCYVVRSQPLRICPFAHNYLHSPDPVCSISFIRHWVWMTVHNSKLEGERARLYRVKFNVGSVGNNRQISLQI